MGFVRKVYSILAVQLSITTGAIVLVQTSDSAKQYMFSHQGTAFAACFGSIFLVFAIVCCFGRVHPVNLILLLLFTACESYMVSGLTCAYDPKIVMMAGAATALTTIALTIYALRTTTQIEVFAAMGFVVYLAMMPLIIIGLFVGLGGLYTLYCCLGVLLYSLYLIIDTIMICGGKSMNGVTAYSMDDYVIGAMMLYLDIVMLFIYILRILGSSK